jgi:hypothetical protein
MTKPAMRHHEPESPAPSQPMQGQSNPLSDIWVHNWEAYAKAWLSWQQEVLRFWGARLQWDGQVSGAFAKCRTMSELAEIQQDWAMSTARDYAEELTRLAQAGANLVPSWMPGAAPHPETPPTRPVD